MTITMAAAGRGTGARACLGFRILGPMQLVTPGGCGIRVAPGKQQLLLAALLINLGRAVERENLLQILWPDEQPEGAPATLKTYVSRMRNTLRAAGQEPELIETVGTGYRLLAEPEQVDALAFDRIVEQARELAAGANLHGARDLLAEAHHLWRGPLNGVNGPWAAAVRTELHRRRVRAELGRIALDSATGTASVSVANELRARTTPARHADPDAVELLLYLLGSARQSREATATYARVSRGLHASGGTPRPELGMLVDRIERGEPVDLAAAEQRAWRRALTPCRLEAAQPLIGREDEVSGLLGAVLGDATGRGGRPVHLLYGGAGLGKRALAASAARHLAAEYCSGAVQFDLRASDPAWGRVTPREVIAHLLDQIGTRNTRPGPEDPEDAWVRAWSEATGDLRLLVLLEDVGDAAQITPILHANPGLTALITSRRRIELPGAREMALAPLNDLAAIRLIAHVAGRHFPDHRRAVHRLTAACGGSPLALVLLGAHLRSAPDVRAAARALQAVLERSAGAGPVAAVYELSAGTLDPDCLDLLEAVAAGVRGQVEAHALAARTGSHPVRARQMLDVLAHLRLLRETDPGCYRIASAVREAALAHAARRR